VFHRFYMCILKILTGKCSSNYMKELYHICSGQKYSFNHIFLWISFRMHTSKSIKHTGLVNLVRWIDPYVRTTSRPLDLAIPVHHIITLTLKSFKFVDVLVLKEGWRMLQKVLQITNDLLVLIISEFRVWVVNIEYVLLSYACIFNYSRSCKCLFSRIDTRIREIVIIQKNKV